jgi:hypothetical protein
MKTIKTPLAAFAGMVLLGSALSVSASTLVVDGTTHTVTGTETYVDFGSQVINGGTLVLESGALTIGAGSNPSIYLTVDATSTIQISGGSHVIGGRHANNNSYGTIQVIGNDATIQFGQFLSPNYTFDFDFDSDGISKISTPGSYSYFGSNASLEVDGSLYTGGDGVFTLFDFAQSGTIFESGNISVTGFDGYDVVLTQDSPFALSGGTDPSGGSIYLTVTVPEPETFALLGGLLALGHVMLRRRRA